jgi:ribosomal protein S18 acetylase RimI-like enzyme
MIPVAPSLLVRPLQREEFPLIAEALNTALSMTPHSEMLEPRTLAIHLTDPNPPSLYPIRWQQHECLCAWRAKRLEGFIDVATGFDSDSLDMPDYRPLGLLRFLWGVNKSVPTDEILMTLLDAAEAFWRASGVAHVKAFHMSTGYPAFQAGLGALPGDWSDVMRALTSADYQLTERFYCLARRLEQPASEMLPLAELNLIYSGTPDDRIYQLYRRADWVGTARVVSFVWETALGAHPMAKLVYIQIDPLWRGMNIGKWLVKRIINDYTLQGYRVLLAHVPHSRPAALRLLTQLGFEEQNYRGYTLEKSLTR